MRRPPVDFQNHLRPFIVRDLKIMAEEKRLTLKTGVHVASITPTSAELACVPGEEGGRCETLPNDFVFALIGHTADRTLFAHLGVPLAKDGLPDYDEKTSESCIPGLYLAGSLSRANIILESRQRAVEIVAHVANRLH